MLTFIWAMHTCIQPLCFKHILRVNFVGEIFCAFEWEIWKGPFRLCDKSYTGFLSGNMRLVRWMLYFNSDVRTRQMQEAVSDFCVRALFILGKLESLPKASAVFVTRFRCLEFQADGCSIFEACWLHSSDF